MEKIVTASQPVFLKLFPECEIESVQLFVDEIKSGSLQDTLIYKFIFRDAAARDRFIARLRQLTGVAYMQGKHELIGQLLAMTLVAGAVIAVAKWAAPGSGINIREVNNSVIVCAGQNLTIPAADLSRFISEGITKKSLLASNVVKVIHPAKLDTNATITIDGNPALTITNAAIHEVPAIAGHLDEVDELRSMTNEVIHVRALDLDNKKKGWWVLIPSLSQRRVRAELSATIDARTLLGGEIHRVDIDVTIHHMPNGDAHPIRAYIRSLHQPTP